MNVIEDDRNTVAAQAEEEGKQQKEEGHHEEGEDNEDNENDEGDGGEVSVQLLPNSPEHRARLARLVLSNSKYRIKILSAEEHQSRQSEMKQLEETIMATQGGKFPVASDMEEATPTQAYHREQLTIIVMTYTTMGLRTEADARKVYDKLKSKMRQHMKMAGVENQDMSILPPWLVILIENHEIFVRSLRVIVDKKKTK